MLISFSGAQSTGKTTLLNFISDNTTCETVYVQQDVTIEETDETIFRFLLKTRADLYKASIRLAELENIETMSDEESDEYNKIIDLLAAEKWDSYKSAIHSVTFGLGIHDLDRQMNILSGGWKVRVALARALIIKPALLLLDEPTNHLDLDAVLWLTNYLANYKKTVVVVTHMKKFVNDIATHTWLIKNYDGVCPKLLCIQGGYDNLCITVEQIQVQMRNEYRAFESKLKKFKTQTRGRNPPKREEIDAFILKHGVPKPPDDVKTRFSFKNSSNFGSSNIVSFEDVSFGYQDQRPLYTNIDFGISTDSRIVLVGDNGVGKTTLFKLCAGILKPTKGFVHVHGKARVSIYDQDIIAALDLTVKPVDYIMREYKCDQRTARSHLGRVGFKRTGDGYDPCSLLIGQLSGGFKARIALLKIIMEEPNIILLDEPTNHLDADTIEFLIEALNQFNGGIVVITHDIDFINDLKNCQVMKIQNGGMQIFQSIDDYSRSTLNLQK